MDVSRVQRGERIAIYGGILLVVGLFLPWYHLKKLGQVGSTRGPADLSGWESHPTLRWFLLAAAVAPLILAYIIARDTKLSWPRGQMTSVVAIAAFGLVAYTGFLDRPGEPGGAISLQLGYFGALLGTILMIVGGAMTAGETERVRKPPGVL